METKSKKSLSELKKNFSDKVLNHEEMDTLKGGKEVDSKNTLNTKKSKWNGFGGFIPQ